jgi:hypothetical protein
MTGGGVPSGPARRSSLSDIADRAAGPEVTAAAISEDERAELERLRAERAGPARRHIGWRVPVAAVLIVAGCLLAPVSVLAVWAGNQVSSTSRYVATMEPLVHDPAVQNVLTDKITSEITTRLGVITSADQAAAALASKGQPGAGTLLKTFALSLSSAATGFIHGQVHKIVAGPQFARAWVRANTIVHRELVKVLSGRGGSSVSVRDGQVVVALGPFIDIVRQDLVKRGFSLVSKVPAINPTLTLFSAKYLVKAQTGYRWINDLKIVLPILAVLLLAVGVYVARSHRRALMSAGLGLAVSMVVLAAGLLIFRAVYLSSMPSSVLPADAAAVLFDTLVRFIKEGLRTVLVAGLVIAVGAFLTGPSVTAVRSRGAVTAGLGWLRRSGERAGLGTGPVGTWTFAHRRALRICAVALAALIFVFSEQPTAASVIVIVILLLVVLGLIELIGHRPPVQAGKTAEL